MLKETTRINLTLPRSWNQCTTEQLETIAACIIKCTALADRYHPFDWMDVKSELFFLLTETEIIREEPTDDPDDTVYVCRLAKRRSRFRLPSRRSSRMSLYHSDAANTEFRIHTWQVQYWIDSHLSWLDDEKQTLISFPYKQLISTRRWQWRWPFVKTEYLSPSELLQDFTWERYRHLQDYMSMYVDQQNALVKTASRRHDKEQLMEQRTALADTRNEFLTVLFGGGSSVPPDGMAIARRKVSQVGEVQWQVILLWWSGMMHYLMQHFPRCFTSTTTKKNPKRPPNPFSLYTSIVTTIQDKAHIDEEKINAQTYTIVLEHLERIAKENEEIEKINRKHK